LSGFGEAIAFGAASIINAIATGKGAALGVDLWTKARVRLTDEAGVIKARIVSEPEEKTTLIEKSVLIVLEYFKLEQRYGAEAETESNIPIARGLKSSSVAANALVLAAADALGRRLNDLTAIKLGVDAAVRAKTTVTGAFDDACASYLGNIVVTDNYERRILRQFRVDEDFTVLFHVPPKKSYTVNSDTKMMKLIAPAVEVAFHEAFSGNFWTALTLNGFLYAAVLGYDQRIAIDALEAGAIASGLTGKGPATAAVVANENMEKVVESWSCYEGDILRAKINLEKAHAVRKE